nr:hypothetical protein [Candidatus Woesearchaeota archaeon]
MLTTYDLYERPGYGIDVGDKVRFELLRGLELRTHEEFKSRIVARSQNPNSNRTVTGTIKDYKPWKPSDLEIEGTMSDGYQFRLRLNQCRDLRILE